MLGKIRLFEAFYCSRILLLDNIADTILERPFDVSLYVSP